MKHDPIWEDVDEMNSLAEKLKTGEWCIFDGCFHRKPLNNELTKWQANDGGIIKVSGIIELFKEHFEAWMIEDLDGVYNIVEYMKDMGWLVPTENIIWY